MRYGYADNTDDKEIYYLRSIHACERLLYLNPELKARVDQGEKIWDAVDVFTVRDMDGNIDRQPYLAYKKETGHS